MDRTDLFFLKTITLFFCISIYCDWNSDYEILGLNGKHSNSLEYISHEAAQLWIVSIGEVVISTPTLSTLSLKLFLDKDCHSRAPQTGKDFKLILDEEDPGN